MPIPAPKAVGADGAGWGSGRRFVSAAVLAVLVLWGSLFLAFRHWRAGYRERQAFGARHVAGAIDPLAVVVPDDVAPDTWRRAVVETHAMLVTLTASNVLDRAQMNALSRRVAVLVALARPETSRADLASLWDEVEARAGPIVRSRHLRPALLPPFRPKDERTPAARR